MQSLEVHGDLRDIVERQDLDGVVLQKRQDYAVNPSPGPSWRFFEDEVVHDWKDQSFSVDVASKNGHDPLGGHHVKSDLALFHQVSPYFWQIFLDELLDDKVFQVVFVYLWHVHPFEVFGFDVSIQKLEGFLLVLLEDVVKHHTQIIQPLAVAHVRDCFVANCVEDALACLQLSAVKRQLFVWIVDERLLCPH